MKRSLPVVVAVAVMSLLFPLGSVQAASGDQGNPTPTIDLSAPHEPDRIIVKFKPNVSQVGVASASAAVGAEVVNELPRLGAQILSVPPEELATKLAVLRSNPNVEYAEPDYIAQLAYDPDDPYYTGGTQWGPQKIQADLAWDLFTGSQDVVIAVIDMGVDLVHPDLQSQLWTNAGEVPGNGQDDDGNGYADDVHGWDFVNWDGDPQDDHGHGTHVAGIAAATADNGTGVAGVGFNSGVMAIKAGNGATGSVRYSAIAQSLYYAADNGADVINLSVGGYTSVSYLRDAVNYAWSKGCVLVGAVGNDNTDSRFYPAAYDNVIGVSGTTQSDAKASWSNYGSQVSVAAPGYGIYSTYWMGTSTYGYLSGTSMAAPHVAGLAALLFAQDGSRTNADVRSLVEETADDLGDAGRDQVFGHGRVNAFRALGQAAGMASTVVDPSYGGTLVSSDGDLTLVFPPGAVSSRTTIDHLPEEPPADPPGNLGWANRACLFQAVASDGTHLEQFDAPFALTLDYQDLDWQLAGIEDESSLNLYHWTGSAWAPCSNYSLDTETNQFVAQLDHFSEFGFMGDKGSTTSVTIASFDAGGDGVQLVQSLCVGLLGLVGLVAFVVAVVLVQAKGRVPQQA
ncbi:MAG: S8 family peptidase [Anaerolineae bacterium]